MEQGLFVVWSGRMVFLVLMAEKLRGFFDVVVLVLHSFV